MKDINIKRIVASFIDFTIIGFIAEKIMAIFTFVKNTSTLSSTTISIISIISITVFLITFFFFLLLRDIVFVDRSIGKKLFKLKVVKTDGTKLMIFDIIKRNLPIIVLLPVEIYLVIVDNRRIGDIWAKTSIVYSDYDDSKRNG